MGRIELDRVKAGRAAKKPTQREFEERLRRMQERGTLGRIERARVQLRTRARPSPKDVGNFYTWIKGKDVIFIGPAGYYEEPDELDYDIVARCNHGFESRTRTDILYVNNFFVRHDYVDDVLRRAEEINIRWVISKHPATIRRLKGRANGIGVFGLREYFLRGINKNFYMAARGNTGANMGLLAIEHLRKTGLNSLTVRGVDFYESGYYDNYSPHHPVIDEEEIEKLQSTKTHDQDMHKKYFKRHIIPDQRVNIDDTLRGILGV